VLTVINHQSVIYFESGITANMMKGIEKV